MYKMIRKTLSALALSVIMATTIFAADQTVIVLGNTGAENQPGAWMFNRDPRTATAFEFNNDEARIGYGSLYAGPITNTNYNGLPGDPNRDKFIAENFVRTDISDVNSISFDFLMGSGASDFNQFYMNVYANFGVSSETKFYDCRYDVVATIGSNATWHTVTFDPNSVYSFAQSSSSPATCPANPSGMGSGAHIRAIAINLGDTSANDLGYDGYFDKVVVDRASGKTTYDFEPYLVATNKNQCKNGGWQTYRRADGTTFRNQGDCIQYVNNGH